MTQRTEMQQRVLEFKASMMARVANRLFTFKQDGFDGFIKRKMLGTQSAKPTSKPAAQKVAEEPKEPQLASVKN